MTSPIRKIFKAIRRSADQRINSQSGVTMLLAILVLSAILAISFSLTTILLLEVRASGDLIRSEQAIYAATGISEQALFNLKRHDSVTCPNGCYSGLFPNNVKLSGAPVVNTTSPPILVDTIQSGTTFNNAKIYEFCDVTAGNGNCGYGKVTVTDLSSDVSSPLVVYLCEFDSTYTMISSDTFHYNSQPCTDMQDTSSSTYWITGSNNSVTGNSFNGVTYYNGTFLSPGGVTTLTWNNLDSNPSSHKQQKLILFNPGSTGDILVSIQTYGAGPNYTPLGLPYVGMSSVTVGINNGNVNRKVQILVPK